MQLVTFQRGLPKLRVSHGTSGSGSYVVTLFDKIGQFSFGLNLSLPLAGLGNLMDQSDCEISSELLRCCAATVIEIIDYEEPVPPEDEILDSDDQARVIACQISMKTNLSLLYVPMQGHNRAGLS